MKAIETSYAGFRFRSRLEARWAVFMDALGVSYQYEPEAYDLDGLFYLPDFFLPSVQSFVEIKGVRPSAEEREKAARLATFSKLPVFIFYGPPQIPFLGFDDRRDYCESAEKFFPDYGWDNAHWWCQCPVCSKIEIQFNGRSDRITCGCRRSEHGDKGYNYASQQIREAYAEAGGYRFEPSVMAENGSCP